MKKYVKFAKGKKGLVLPGIELETLESIFSCQRLNHWAIVLFVFGIYKELFLNDYVSWLQHQVQSTRVDPSRMEWTNQNAGSRHACSRRSTHVNDAGALAPIVFSGE